MSPIHSRERLPFPCLGSLATLLLVSIGLLMTEPAEARRSLSVREIADALGFSESDRERVEEGDFVWIAQEEETKKQISLAAAAFIPVDLDAAYTRSVGAAVFREDETLLAFGEIEDPTSAAGALAKMPLDDAELEHLARSEPGSEFNFSSREWEAIGAVDPKDRAGLARTWRSLLAARVERFAKEGIAGIESYDRGDGDRVDAGAELRGLLEASKVLRLDWPAFYDSILGYPKIVTEEPIDSRFFWTIQKIQDRPTPILRHRMTIRGPDRVLMIDRQFYAGQSYNVLQIATGAFEIEGRTVLIYSNRTSTDQVAGFGSAAAHKIGRTMMAKEVEALFDTVIEALDDDSS